MSLRVFISYCDERFWVDTIYHLHKHQSWTPIYWLGGDKLEPDIRKYFPDIPIHFGLNAIRGIPHPDFKAMPLLPLEPSQIKSLAFEQTVTLKLMDRMDSGYTFNYQERLRLYYTYLQYWSSLLKHLKPDLFFTGISPHMPQDYLILKLCQQQGIRTLMFEQTSMTGYVYPIESFETDSKVLLARYHAKINNPPQEIELSPELKTYVANIQASYTEAMPLDSRQRLAAERSFMSRLVDLNTPFWLSVKTNLRHWRVLRRTLKRWLTLEPLRTPLRRFRRFLSHPKPSYLKVQGKKIEDSWLNNFSIHRAERKGRKYRRALAYYYRQFVTTNPPLDIPYILVSLNYQPERTTVPCGDVFGDQFLMVDMLSKLVPAGWQIYVKEHPRQFSTYRSRGHMARIQAFYDDLVKLPNVRLLPVYGQDLFNLIDHAQAVATVTGKTAWEGVLRGKPALVFGYAWYRACEGIFHVLDITSCRQALAQIEGGYQVNPVKVQLFLQTVEEVGVRAWLDELLAYQIKITPAENAKRLAEAVQAFEVMP